MFWAGAAYNISDGGRRTPLKPKKLIINADDFGMSEEITDGILISHSKGVTTSTSLLVNMPDSERAAKAAREYPSLGVGVHLNISRGIPVLPAERIPSLVDGEGRFFPSRILIPRIKRLKVRRSEIEAEFSAQIEKSLSLGVDPSHLDSHHYVHIYPASALAFRDAARRFGIDRIRTVRFFVARASNTTNSTGKPPGSRRRLSVRLKNIYKMFLHQCIWRGMRSPKYALMPSLLWPDEESGDFQAGLIQTLRSMPGAVCELVCHPGLAGGGPADEKASGRGQELAALTSPAVREAIRECDIGLINYDFFRNPFLTAPEKRL